MIDNKKEEYAHAINRYTENIIEGLIPKRIVPFDYYEERDVDEEVKNWIEGSDRGFAVIVGDAGFGKTNLLCNLANKFLNEEQYAVFFVKSENLKGKEFDKKILEDFEITETGLNAFLRKIIDENEKVIFLLDTLDISATDDGIARLDDFLTKIKGEKRVVIGASRPLEFKKIEQLTTKTFELKPFSDAEIQRLFEKYKAFYSMEGVELRLPVLEVCRNPLHMRMLFEVYQPNEIPEDINTQKLYDRYWDKKIAEIRIGVLSYLDKGKKRRAEEIKEDLAKSIASEMFASKQITLRRSNTKNIKDEMREDYSKMQSAEVRDSTDVTITQILKEPAVEYDTIIDDAYYDLLDEGVLRAQEDSVEFFHQTFFEYAAARALIEEEDKEQLEYLLNNTTLLENRAIIQQVMLYAKRKKKDEIALEFLKKLSKTNLYTKIFVIDLLKHIENIEEGDIKIYQHLTKDKFEIKSYLIKGLLISVHPDIASTLIKKLSNDKDRAVRGSIAKALPKLCDINPDLASSLFKKLSNDKYAEVRGGIAKALPKLCDVNPDLALSLFEKLSKDKDKNVQRDVAKALPKLCDVNPDLALSLFEKLNKDMLWTPIYSDGQEAGAKILPKLCDVNPDLASRLIEKLSKDEDWRVQRGIAETLPKLCDLNPDLTSKLIEKLSKNKDRFVRTYVAETLLKLAELKPKEIRALT